MTTFSGTLPFDREFAKAPSLAAGIPPANVDQTAARVGYHGLSFIGGSFTDNLTVSLLTQSLPGYYSKSYLDDYYNRIWLIPAILDFGSINDDTSAFVYVWNAWLVDVNLTGITLSDLTGVTITAGKPVPSLWKALEMPRYTVNMPYVGPPDVDGDIFFAFDTSETMNLIVRAKRAFLWEYSFWPNWREQVQVTYEYKTEVFEARDGAEQRRAMRQTPDKRIEFLVTVDNDNRSAMRDFRRFMDRALNKTIVMPEWPRRVNLTAQGSISDTSIFVDEVKPWMVDGAVIVLANAGEERAKLYTIDTISGLEVSLAAALTEAWPLGSQVIAGVAGRLQDTTTSRDLTSHTTEAQIKFRSFRATENAGAFHEGAAETIFDGREVFPFTPNWREPVGQDAFWPVEEVDFGFGRQFVNRHIDFITRMQKMTFLSVEDVERFTSFFFRQKGKRGEFWLPSFENDFELREIAATGLNRIRVKGPDTARAHANSKTHKAVMVWFADGTRLPLKIVQILEESDLLGNDTIIEFTSLLPRDVGGPDTITIDWLFLSRFASDDLVIGHETVDVAQLEMTGQTLKYAEAE